MKLGVGVCWNNLLKVLMAVGLRLLFATLHRQHKKLSAEIVGENKVEVNESRIGEEGGPSVRIKVHRSHDVRVRIMSAIRAPPLQRQTQEWRKTP